ncbi:MAG: hypothetical protein K6E97_01890 [Treponema sp.]|nr:hypothetical protein [Treponema sp.]
MNIEQSDYGQGIGAAAGQLRSNEADSGTAESPVFCEAKNGPWIMHEYDNLGEKHKTLKTWCKIKADAGTEYWVNKDDFDFKSKDGSKIGLVYYDKWEDFFCEINPSKYGEFKCNDEKAFIKDYSLEEFEINTAQDIPARSKTLKKFYYKAESEWSDNQKITDEYVNLSPSQEKETTEYRKDLAFFTDDFLSKLSNFKLSKKNYYFNPIAFLHHLDKVATPAEFNPYEGKPPVTINANSFINQTRTQILKDNPGFAPYNTNLSQNGYEYNKLKYAYITCLFDCKTWKQQ